MSTNIGLGRKNMFAERLKAARKMAGLSLERLAQKMDGIVTKQAIHKYETGKAKPNATNLIALADALNVSTDYFYSPSSVQLTKLEYRKKSSRLNKTKQEQIELRTLNYLERYIEIENFLNIHSDFKNPFEGKTINTEDEIESTALELRKQWGFGDYSIDNLTDKLEEKGIKVLEIEADPAFDGLSGFVNKIPVIVINKTNNDDICRKRLTILHELSHLLINFPDDTDNKCREKLCYHFAGAFLIPKHILIKHLGARRTSISILELITLKETYGISIQAIMARAVALGIISKAHYENFCKWINKHNYRVNEPGKYLGAEQSERFKSLIYRAVSEELVSLAKAASLFGKNLYAFRQEYFAYGK